MQQWPGSASGQGMAARGTAHSVSSSLPVRAWLDWLKLEEMGQSPFTCGCPWAGWVQADTPPSLQDRPHLQPQPRRVHAPALHVGIAFLHLGESGNTVINIMEMTNQSKKQKTRNVPAPNPKKWAAFSGSIADTPARK